MRIPGPDVPPSDLAARIPLYRRSLRIESPALMRMFLGTINALAMAAAILTDATNLGLARMAQASQGVTRDQLVWTACS